MKQLLLILFFCTFSKIAFNQSLTKEIILTRGRGVEFVFRSLNHIANGKSLGSVGNGYTEIKIKYDTTGFYLPETTGWQLIAYANTSELEADMGGTGIDISNIRLHYSITEGTGTVSPTNSLLTTNSSFVIASGSMGNGTAASGGTEWTVTVAYDCGKESGTGLMGYDSDYYYTDLIYYLKAAP